MLWASQVAPGNENCLMLRVHGTKAGIEWSQEDPNTLWFAPFGEPKRLITRGGAGSGAGGSALDARAAGPPRGLSRGLREHLQRGRGGDLAAREGKAPGSEVIFPTIEDGVKGVAFVEACVRSSKRNAAWVTLYGVDAAGRRAAGHTTCAWTRDPSARPSSPTVRRGAADRS